MVARVVSGRAERKVGRLKVMEKARDEAPMKTTGVGGTEKLEEEVPKIHAHPLKDAKD